MKKLWDDLDNFYVFRKQTVREMTRDLIKNPKVGREDAEGMMQLAAELASVESEARRNGIQRDLDNQELIGEIIEARIPFEAKEFYTEEAKKAVNDKNYTSKYKDLMEYVKVRARVNQSRGQAKTYCKIAMLSDDRATEPRKSPIKEPTDKPRCQLCQSMHNIWDCNVLQGMSMEAKVETLMKQGLCFRCMKKEKHRSRECTANHMRCGKCKRTNHYEVICGMPAYLGKKRADEEAAKRQANKEEGATGGAASAGTEKGNEKA